MKHSFLLAILVLLITSCESIFTSKENAELVFSFDKTALLTRSAAGVPALPDTNDFILTVCDSRGGEVYHGKYGAVPERLVVPSGSYSVRIRSSEVKLPAFDCPVYGDDELVCADSGATCHIVLECSQVNSGVKLVISPGFIEACPNDVLCLKGNEGRLVYFYSEDRIAYFNPGPVSVILSGNDGEKVLMTDVLEPREILTVNVRAGGDRPEGTGRTFSVALDTSRVWQYADCIAGGDSGDPGSSPDNAIGVSVARSMPGMKGVWVYGYVVGGDLTSTKVSFVPPFSSRTNLAISAKSSASARDNCLSVQLEKGDIRDSLNLVDNPWLIGRTVFLQGDIVDSYYGMPGIRNILDYRIK